MSEASEKPNPVQARHLFTLFEVSGCDDHPREWHVMAMSDDGKHTIGADFWGPWAKERAEEYARWKNEQGKP